MNFLKALLFLPTIGLISCFQNAPAPSNNYPNKLISQALDSVAQGFIDQKNVMGLAIAIVDDRDTLYNKGFGYADSARTQLVNSATIFKLASISKLIGSTVVMRLQEEGVLSIDQSLLELLPDFPNKDQAKKITLRHLLSHTSGLQDYASYIDTIYLQTRIPPTEEDFYQFFATHELFFEPGTEYSYCNSGFLLMAMIVERLTGNTWQQEVNRIVNQPGGMSLRLISENASHPSMTEYFEWKSSKLNPRPFWTWIKGDGGLTTTPLELAHFPKHWASGSIISPESFQEMSQPYQLEDGIFTGYGLGVRNGLFIDEKIIGHTGGNKTNLSIMVYFPERKLTIVVCVNTDNTSSQARAIFSPIAQTILGLDTPNYQEKEIAHENLKMYVGKYLNYGYKSSNSVCIELNPKDNHLYYKFEPNTNGEKMYYLGNNEFWISRWPWDRLVFDLHDQDQARALKEYYGGFYVLLRKKSP